MVALELMRVADGKYKNSPEASFYLVEGKLSIGRPTWKPLDRRNIETLAGEPV